VGLAMVKKIQVKDFEDLYRAQLYAQSAIDSINRINSKINRIVSKIFLVLGYLNYPIKYFPLIGKIVFPLNPINNKREFSIIPKLIEKILGKLLFFDLYVRYQGINAFKKPSQLDLKRKEDVERVTTTLVEGNKKLLGLSDSSKKRPYQCKVFDRNILNAFAVPGGQMVVFSELIDRIRLFHTWHFINTSKVTMPDGTQVIVDLSSVKYEDVLACLIGHEMTHCASRHSVLGLSLVIILNAVNSMSKVFFRKNKDQTLAFVKLLSIIRMLIALRTSRKNEYEADVTGSYFAYKSGYNPLGALYLMEIFKQEEGIEIKNNLFEVFLTHPLTENRKTSLYAGISQYAPDIILSPADKGEMAG